MLNMFSCSFKKRPSIKKKKILSVFPERYENKVTLQQHLGTCCHGVTSFWVFRISINLFLTWKTGFQYCLLDLCLLSRCSCYECNRKMLINEFQWHSLQEMF